MKRPIVSGLMATLILASALRGAEGNETFNSAMERAAVEYRQRVERAADELNRTRARIADEKAPLLQRQRAAEDRLITAESESTRYQTREEDTAEQRRKLLIELDGLRKSTTYLTTLAHESVKAATDGLAPGETQAGDDRLPAIQKQLDDPNKVPSAVTAVETVEYLLSRTERALGGYRVAGSAMLAETNQVLPGTFAFVGPETYFFAESGGAPGVVRPREGAKHPVSYALPTWKPEEAKAFFSGSPGTIVADASGGKALRLKETTGTVWEHVKKGGVVAYAIVAVGILAAFMIVQKIRDLSRMAVDSPRQVATFLEIVARGATVEAERAIKGLKRTTRELFAAGLQYAGQPKTILEERLQAVLLEQRLYYERRLPLLAVIATAAPLMGLLGTVVGMVKTFALITVFGTGNAGKLSSGISEVLVATELGLAVAIPALVAHGFLAHRIQKNLSLLERYALQFATAVETARVSPGGEPRRESVPA
jgi:biopolymer transport protein ExbB